MLCFTLQRYKIESNSQPISERYEETSCCVSHCKDTKLKAIHNQSGTEKISALVVFHTAKIQNWKQFTTSQGSLVKRLLLCFTLQRYKIESNSQQPFHLELMRVCCVSHCKDTKLKAIHNEPKEIWRGFLVVFHTA